MCGERFIKQRELKYIVLIINHHMKRASVLTAMFGSSWFGKLACGTGGPRVKQPPVIGVGAQLTRDLLFGYCACQERANKPIVVHASYAFTI